jgi:hypothetical protein
MDPFKRKTMLALLALPAGCTIQALAPVRTQPLAEPSGNIQIRPPRIGQSWTYEKRNFYNSLLIATETEEVVALEPRIVLRRKNEAGLPLAEEQQLTWGRILRDPTWDFVQNYADAVDLWPQSLAVGAKSSINTHYTLDDNSFRFAINDNVVVKSWEKVFLTRGEFNALRIERIIQMRHVDHSRQQTVRRTVYWLVPEIGRWVAREIDGEYLIPTSMGGNWVHEDRFRWELTAWT